MKKINKKLIISIALIIFITFIFSNNIFALNPDEWNPEPSLDGSSSFVDRVGNILGWIKYIGILISVIVITIIGIKYMLCSMAEKAEYKKAVFPYVIGCFMLMGISIVIGMIESIATS